MKKKKKGKGIVIAIIVIAIVIAGGYLIYDSFLGSGDAEAETIEPVEVKSLASISLDVMELDGALNDSTNREIFDLMNENDATYYKIKNKDNTLVVSQINEEDFNEISPKTVKTTRKFVNNGMKYFLNMSYKSLPGSLYSLNGTSSSTIFGKNLLPAESDEYVKGWIKETFGKELRQMFEEYKLKLSCDDISIKKMAVYDTGRTQKCGNALDSTFDAKYYEYYFVVDANVKTEEASKKISELGVFADAGEDKDIEFLLYCDGNDAFEDTLMIKKILL